HLLVCRTVGEVQVPVAGGSVQGAPTGGGEVFDKQVISKPHRERGRASRDGRDDDILVQRMRPRIVGSRVGIRRRTTATATATTAWRNGEQIGLIKHRLVSAQRCGYGHATEWAGRAGLRRPLALATRSCCQIVSEPPIEVALFARQVEHLEVAVA